MGDRSGDKDIVYAKIHPSIGIARVGNSKDEFYIGPQVVEPKPQPAGFYRDSTGALKREVAQFRIYGYDAQGKVVRELYMDKEVQVEWTVELANHKAAWYNFELALDIPEAASLAPTRRNADVKAPQRSALSILPGARTIKSPNAQGDEYRFGGGKFFDTEVPLGELRTDAHGRLQVFGGHGKSGSCDGKAPVTFANNDGWYDDTSDGPVTARVRLDGRELEVAPAWVVVAPPNYGPQQKSVRTLYALMTDLAVQAGQLPAPLHPSFRDDILPIFKAMCDLQWMNSGFAAGFGHGMAQHFLAPDYLHKLSQPGETYAELRRTVANSFRNPEDGDISMKPWPWVYGDAMNVPMPLSPRAMNALSTTQLALLDRWAEGKFIADYDPKHVPEYEFDKIPLQQQPATLDRAALEFCLADAFHPGCEVTWPVRHATMYMEPYRWRHRSADNPEPDYGANLTPTSVASYNGPLYAQFPGSITRWMAVPWQTDTASCRSGYDKQYDPHLPTFWPARVPNQVLSADNYRKVVDASLSKEERLRAFNERSDWNRTLGITDPLQTMVDHFDRQGIVEVRYKDLNDPDFPDVMQVEDRGGDDLSSEAQELVDHDIREMLIAGTPRV
ncbi:LodA/GoxA family CTQ-dependent oxidase [Pseudomonas sp. 21LCFQ02]|uniref:LodA/GoxA family CTQ-dependent oxidase n=1 Tax=Pseudomonas sp. 21LCFQ02 TaxID=2957505 RepID=UPI00209A67D0|nr:LodA/GoxA family CTQ-dependent oxidase [Pseudomonas sp. 21LCFQ02]MCO8166394.1 LodA/GoxA family CTQ-dependent oxidase [Pseudomonas sp. 21LCFQ02]